MRLLAVSLVFVTALAAQRGGGMGGFRGSPGRGFSGGGVAHHPSGFIGGGVYNRGFVGGYRPGFPGGGFRYPHYAYPGARYSYYPFIGFGLTGFGYGGFGYYPYTSYGSYYSPYYDYAYPGGPSGSTVTVVTAPAAAETSPGTIIINNSGWERFQRRGQAEDTEVRQPSAAPQAEQRQPEARSTRSPIYLIALNTGVIWMAVAYWSEGGNLHFVTTKGEKKQIRVGELDRPLTEQLNQERNVPFRLR